MRNKIQFYIFLCLTLCAVLFIFRNSFQSSEASREQSGVVVEVLKPPLDPEEQISEEDFHVVVRKAAHFLEFALLGFCLGFMTDGLRRRFWKEQLVFLPIGLTFLVASADELIQAFNDRSGMVKDVFLDISGGLFGLLVVVGFTVLFSLRKREV